MGTIGRSDLISLTLAADHSPYSSEYLSLRARQGKLRAEKRGRVWMTTLGWLEDYMAGVEQTRAELRGINFFSEASKPDEEFEVKSVATLSDSADRPNIGLVIKEDIHYPTGKEFAWDVAETPRIQSQAARIFDELRQRPETNVIELAEPRLRDEDSILAVASEPASEKIEWAGAVRSIYRPVLAIGATFVIVIGLLVFDGPLAIRQNIVIGFGLTAQSLGENLMMVGENQNVRAGRSKITLIMPRPNILVQADEAMPTQPLVAGATTTNPNIGFWPTVALGARIFLGLDIVKATRLNFLVAPQESGFWS